MREAEFIQLLDRVDAALNPAPVITRTEENGVSLSAPPPANDNDAPWSHAPFPRGWMASC